MDVDVLGDGRSPSLVVVEDPLGRDLEDDIVVTTTRRAISRVAFVAAEAASRFEREMVDHDPVAWMMAPRRLFGGAAALDACLGREAFLRASLLHGLSIGLDADPMEIDVLLDDDEDDTCALALDDLGDGAAFGTCVESGYLERSSEDDSSGGDMWPNCSLNRRNVRPEFTIRAVRRPELMVRRRGRAHDVSELGTGAAEARPGHMTLGLDGLKTGCVERYTPKGRFRRAA